MEEDEKEEDRLHRQTNTVLGSQRTETHAYGISHLGRGTSTPLCIPVTTIAETVTDTTETTTIFPRDDNDGGLFPIQESEEDRTVSSDANDHEYVSPGFFTNLEAIESFSSTTDLATISANERLQKSESLKLTNKYLTKENTDLKDAKYFGKTDHVYEEVSAFECDIMDYYEKYSPTTAKTLINTLFLPRQKICKQCANLENSPVYSDRLVYGKEPLRAREVRLFQQNDALCFKYCPENGERNNGTLYSQYDNTQHRLLVYPCTKTNASSIFYFYGPANETFDLKRTMLPNIILGSSYETKGTENITDLYHRCGSNCYTRISSNPVTPAFQLNHKNVLSTIKHVGYDTDLQNWINYRNDVFRSHACFKHEDAIAAEHRPNRSSLLLLEPLLLMPEFTRPGNSHGKNNRLAQSEHMKIIKIVIAYTLSFFILATITFYIVYFT